MAFTASGLFVKTFHRGLGGGTPITVDFDGDTIKAALYTNTISPDYSADTGYSASPWTANEAGASGSYSAGGGSLASKTWSELNSSQLTFDAADLSFTTATLTLIKGALIYDDTVTGKLGMAGVVFPTTYSSVAGTFSITWDALGIFYIDCF